MFERFEKDYNFDDHPCPSMSNADNVSMVTHSGQSPSNVTVKSEKKKPKWLIQLIKRKKAEQETNNLYENFEPKQLHNTTGINNSYVKFNGNVREMDHISNRDPISCSSSPSSSFSSASSHWRVVIPSSSASSSFEHPVIEIPDYDVMVETPFHCFNPPLKNISTTESQRKCGGKEQVGNGGREQVGNDDVKCVVHDDELYCNILELRKEEDLNLKSFERGSSSRSGDHHSTALATGFSSRNNNNKNLTTNHHTEKNKNRDEPKGILKNGKCLPGKLFNCSNFNTTTCTTKQVDKKFTCSNTNNETSSHRENINIKNNNITSDPKTAGEKPIVSIHGSGNNNDRCSPKFKSLIRIKQERERRNLDTSESTGKGSHSCRDHDHHGNDTLSEETRISSSSGKVSNVSRVVVTGAASRPQNVVDQSTRKSGSKTPTLKSCLKQGINHDTNVQSINPVNCGHQDRQLINDCDSGISSINNQLLYQRSEAKVSKYQTSEYENYCK